MVVDINQVVGQIIVCYINILPPVLIDIADVQPQAVTIVKDTGLAGHFGKNRVAEFGVKVVAIEVIIVDSRS